METGPFVRSARPSTNQSRACWWRWWRSLSRSSVRPGFASDICTARLLAPLQHTTHLLEEPIWPFIHFISFRECLRRCFSPADGILICFMEAQQAAIQFCDRTRVANLLHGLLLSAITEWRWGKTQSMHVSATWALACAETVQQCPGIARQVEARLLDTRVSYKMTNWLLTTAADDPSSSHGALWSTGVVCA